MPTPVPAIIQPLLADYLDAIQSQLANFLEGFYLHGSIALDAFQPAWSDIDFIVVISSPCTPQELRKLAQIHQHLAEKYPQWQLSGAYLQAQDLGQSAENIAPAPHYHDGILHPEGHHEINPITWYLLKNKGITLFGKSIQEYSFTVDWEKLIAEMRLNLNQYWGSYTRNPPRMAWLLSDYGIQWTILGVLRQYYSFQENEITSKVGAGEYALTKLPQWQKIIQEALNIRQQQKLSLYSSPILRAIDAFRFLKFIIKTCNQAKI